MPCATSFKYAVSERRAATGAASAVRTGAILEPCRAAAPGSLAGHAARLEGV